MFLLTSHGTVICISSEGNELLHLRPDRLRDTETPLCFGDLSLSYGLDFKAFLEKTIDIRIHSPNHSSILDLLLRRTSDLRTVSVTRGEFYMTALPDGRLGFHSREANSWELYIALDVADLKSIQFILTNTWIEAATGAFILPEAINFREGWKLQLGQAMLDLRLQFPGLSKGLPFRLTGLHEGWRIAQFFLYKPFVYFTAFRSSEVLKQLYLSLQSLLEFGRYDGWIHLITDQSTETILENVPDLDASKLSIQTIDPADWIGYVAAKYAILEHEAAYKYQPVFFNDPDIVFDSEITPVLKAIAGSDRITAPIEGGLLRTFPSLGAALYRRDGFDPGFANGFNAGTLGIPNLHTHAGTLVLIRSIIVNHALLHGRDYHHWVDQEVANYVSFRIGHVDTHSISRYVRTGFPGTDKTAQGRCGLVHFWASYPKAEVMENYIHTLRSALKGLPK